MEDILAKSCHELLDILRKTNISVPPRGCDRTHEHRERWTISRLLSTLAEKNELSFPIHLHKQESPDFILKTGNKTIGIEITEAIQEDLSAALNLLAKKKTITYIELSHFTQIPSTKSREELDEIILQKKLTGKGWKGDEMEIQWAEAILYIIDKKQKRLKSKSFEILSTNWLSIYDNLHFIGRDLRLCLKYLSPKLHSYWPQPLRFDWIFIESRNEVFRITDAGYERLILNDLWKNS